MCFSKNLCGISPSLSRLSGLQFKNVANGGVIIYNDFYPCRTKNMENMCYQTLVWPNIK
jgi:hypothetical protein